MEQPGRQRGAGAAGRPDASAFELFRHLVTAFLAYVAEGLRRAVERRRVSRIRRNPAAVQAALRSAKALLIVCRGNMVRSPFAAQVLRDALPGCTSVSIRSAGLDAVPGRVPHPTALRMAMGRRIDLSCHCASPVTSDHVAASDAIFVMDVRQLVALRDRFPDARGKTFLLTSLAPELPLEIGDPVEGDDAVFQVCFDHISRSVRPIVRTISAGAHQ
jgi:protein-tyrosine phosphatase